MADELTLSVAMQVNKDPAPPAGVQFGSRVLDAGIQWNGPVLTVTDTSTAVPLGPIAQGDVFYFTGCNLGSVAIELTDGEDGALIALIPANGPWCIPVNPDHVLFWNTVEEDETCDVQYGLCEQAE